MEKEPRFRILNKTRETVTLKLQDKPMTFSWEEFNKKLIVVDKVWAVLNEEEKKKQEKAEELISDAVVSMMIQRGNSDAGTKLAHMAMLGKYIDEAAELLECNRLEVMQIIRKRLMMLNPFMVNPMFSEEDMNRSGIHHKRTHRVPNHDKDGNREVVSTVENKPTLGDAFSCLGELKEKMEKES
jgi:hypothetical protein